MRGITSASASAVRRGATALGATSRMTSTGALSSVARTRCLAPAAAAARINQHRTIQISASPTNQPPRLGGDSVAGQVADARFEVMGAPHSMLSVSLAASQRLYTRRGTLVAVTGKPETAQSTLSLLSPAARAPLGVPFVYQRITATTPISALISTKSSHSTFTVLHLDGTTDWMVSQRSALLAWSGHSLSVAPRVQHRLPLAHWGSSELTGRGVAALSAPGHIYQVSLAAGEEFVAHPANVVAYTVTREPPQPFRFKSSSLRLQVPSAVSAWVGETRFVREMRKTQTYKLLTRLAYAARTAARRTVWGDRLFLQFKGPATLLMSSRAPRVADVLTDADVNEIADAPAGVLPAAVDRALAPPKPAEPEAPRPAPVRVNVATVGEDGKVKIGDTKKE